MQNETIVGDLYQAAYLVGSGCEFPKIVMEHNRSERGLAKFVFEDPDGLVAWHLEAWRLDHGIEGEELLMPVKKFINAIRRLKSAMGGSHRKEKRSYENGKETT